MHQLRCILAAMFAILIVNPACCCASMIKVEKVANHSCCESSRKEKKETPCDCAAKAPQISESQPAPSHQAVFIAPAHLPELPAMPPALECEPDLSPVALHVDTGPPRLRLALLQRYLI